MTLNTIDNPVYVLVTSDGRLSRASGGILRITTDQPDVVELAIKHPDESSPNRFGLLVPRTAANEAVYALLLRWMRCYQPSQDQVANNPEGVKLTEDILEWWPEEAWQTATLFVRSRTRAIAVGSDLYVVCDALPGEAMNLGVITGIEVVDKE